MAGLFNESPELRVEEVQITRSAGYGFVLSLEGSFSPDSSGLHVTESAVSAFAEVWATGTIPDGDLTGNEIDAIDLPGGQVKESARWDAKNVDYRLLNDTYVDGIDGEPVTLTLGPGTTLQFGDSRGLYVGYSGPAALIAVGTEKAPLLFRGERKIAGSWAGVGIRSNDSGSRLEHFELSHGGTSFPLDGALHLQEAATSVDQGYIHDNAECGIWLDGGTSELGPNMVYEENDEGDLCGPEDED